MCMYKRVRAHTRGVKQRRHAYSTHNAPLSFKHVEQLQLLPGEGASENTP